MADLSGAGGGEDKVPQALRVGAGSAACGVRRRSWPGGEQRDGAAAAQMRWGGGAGVQSKRWVKGKGSIHRILRFGWF